MNRVSKCLFGGALLSAGIAPNVQAQNFMIGNSYAMASVVTYSYQSSFDSQFNTGPFNVSAYVGNAVIQTGGTAYATSSIISASAFINSPNGYTAYSFGWNHYVDFRVDLSCNATFNWDWTTQYSFLRLTDLTTNSVLFFQQGQQMGTQSIALDDHHDYRIEGASAVDGSTQNSFWNVRVPAPGTAGVLGLIGLVTARRRR